MNKIQVYIPLMYDFMAKSVFSNLKCINCTTTIEKKKKVDILLETEKDIINIEINNNYFNGLIDRNCAYIFNIASKKFKVGDNYVQNKKYIKLILMILN